MERGISQQGGTAPVALEVVQWNVNGFSHERQAGFLTAQKWDIACLQEVTRQTWPAWTCLAPPGQLSGSFDPTRCLSSQAPGSGTAGKFPRKV